LEEVDIFKVGLTEDIFKDDITIISSISQEPAISTAPELHKELPAIQSTRTHLSLQVKKLPIWLHFYFYRSF